MILFSYAATVNVPAAVPIATELVIVDALFVPASLIVPLFNDTGFATTLRTSLALVAALLARIAFLKVSSFVPDPDK